MHSPLGTGQNFRQDSPVPAPSASSAMTPGKDAVLKAASAALKSQSTFLHEVEMSVTKDTYITPMPSQSLAFGLVDDNSHACSFFGGLWSGTHN